MGNRVSDRFELTHAEIAEILTAEEGRTVTQQQVCNLEHRAIAKLRRIMAQRQLKGDDLLPD